MKKVKLLISSLSLVAMNVFATDVYVTVSGAGNGSGSDWANAKNDLGEVLYNASAGTTVHVGAGVYKPTVDYKGNSTAPNIEKRFKLSGGVTVLGGYPSTGGAERNVQENETILDGAINDTDTVYTIAYGLLGEQDIVVDGFIFRHATGRMSGPDNDYMGDFSGGAGAIVVLGGTLIPDATSPAGSGLILINCVFDGFKAKWGGAIKLQKPDQSANPKLTLTSCSFFNNISGQNGGGVLTYNWDVDVENSTFEGNFGGSGGAIACFGSMIVNATESTFKGNSCSSNGAGILCYAEEQDAGSEMTVRNCDFIENDGWDGVGVYSNKSSNCVVEGCTFDKNTGGGAGAVRLDGTFTITDCVFNGNEINAHPGGWFDGSVGAISNCIYTNNKSAARQNGVIFKVQMGEEINVTNCYATGKSGKSIAGIGWGSSGLMKNVSIVNNTGTAIAFQGAAYTCQNMTISGNSSPTNGGIIDGSWEGASSISIYDCTIVGNSSADGQNAMYISGGTATIDFDNCIYVENGDKDADYGTVFGSFVRNYCIWDDTRYGEGRFYPLDSPFTVGTYLAPIAEVDGQYVHLLTGENNPAVGNGSPNSSNTEDQTGRMRPASPSIGAVEYRDGSGIDAVEQTQLNVYPSVTTGQLVVTNPFAGTSTLCVYSIDGSLVKRINLGIGDNLLNFSDLGNGTYLVSLHNGATVVTSRIVKR